eukprot:101933-Pyramimonas_sp.AAC.1
MSTRKKTIFRLFEKCFQKLSLSTLSTLTRERSSTRFPAQERPGSRTSLPGEPPDVPASPGLGV